MGKIKLRCIVVSVSLVLTLAPGSAQAQISPISRLTVPHTVIDFEPLPPGPTDIESILATYPGTALADITVWSFTFDDYDACPTDPSGPSLGGNPNGSGNLFIVNVGEEFASNAYIVEFTEPVTQFAFSRQDEAGGTKFVFFLGEQEVGDIIVNAACNLFVGFESEHPFDRVVFDSPFSGGYLLDKLYIPDVKASDDVPASARALHAAFNLADPR